MIFYKYFFLSFYVFVKKSTEIQILKTELQKKFLIKLRRRMWSEEYGK